jgi:hypothetical protein
MTVYLHSFLALIVMNGQAVCCSVSPVLHQLALYVFNCSMYSHLDLVGLCGMSVYLYSGSISLGLVKKGSITLFRSVFATLNRYFINYPVKWPQNPKLFVITITTIGHFTYVCCHVAHSFPSTRLLKTTTYCCNNFTFCRS